MVNILVNFVVFIFGGLLGAVIFGKKYLSASFLFNMNLCEIIDVLLTIIIGIGVGYFAINKNSRETKKKEYGIKLLEDAEKYLNDNLDSVCVALEDCAKLENRKIALPFFKFFGSKVEYIEKLVLNCNNEVDYIKKEYDKYEKEFFLGSETSFEQAKIMEFKKDMESIKTTLQRIILKCLDSKISFEKK